MVEQILRPLEPFGELLADRLLDHAGAGEANKRVGLGDLHIAQHRVGGGHAAGRRVCQHHDIGQARLFQHLDRHGRARHLHQRQDAFLHPRATGGGEKDERAAKLNGLFGPGDDGVADIHAHRAAHEREILRGGDNRRPADIAFDHQHRLFLARRLLGGFHAVGVFLLVAEVQWIGQRFRHGDFLELAAIEQRLEAVARRDRHVMAARGADILIVRQFAVEQHGSAFIAFGPEVLGNLTAREERVDLGADVVGDPVHSTSLGNLLIRDKPSVRELQSTPERQPSRKPGNPSAEDGQGDLSKAPRG